MVAPDGPESAGAARAHGRPLRGEVAIEVAGLSKRYEIYRKPHLRLLQTLMRGRRTFFDEFWALREVSLTVRRGETVGIVGRNGSGKSTLLQLVAGTLHPTAGSVRTYGRVAALLELGSGFNPEFTGRENVYVNGAIFGISRREMDAAFPAIAAFAAIGDFIDQPVKTYSSGMTVRLAFAVAVNVTPDILIVDEALAVGDTAFQAKCLDRIRRMQDEGVAILLVSHSSNAVIEYCDRAAYLDRGRLMALGPCREVVERYLEDVTRAEAQAALRAQQDADTTMYGIAVPTAADERPTEIVSVRIGAADGAAKSVFGHGEEVHVTLEVAFHRANQTPCFGIQLASTDGIALWATTTAFMNRRVAPVAAGTSATFTWRFPARLGGSRYIVALGVGDSIHGEYRRHDRLTYAGHFDVLSQARRGAGWLDIEAAFVDREDEAG